MRLFRRAATTPDWSPVVDDVAAQSSVAALREGDAGPALGLLRLDRDDPEARSHHTTLLGQEFDQLAEFTELDGLTGPDLADRLLVLGRSRITEAWAIRGSGPASTVGEQRFDIFHATLAEAIPLLQHAAALMPNDPTPWVALQPVAMGLQASLDDRDALFREAIARSPGLYPAYASRQQIMCKKWGGDNADMLEFTRGVADAPAGDPLACLLATAHLEIGLDWHTGADSTSAMTEQIRRNLDELRTASDRFSTAPSSSLHRYEAHNVFAVAFCVGGDRDRARRHLDAMGTRFDRHPWSYFGDPNDAYQRLSRSVR